MTMLESAGRDLYLRETDTRGRTRVASYRVWDVVAFLAEQQRRCANVIAFELRDATIAIEPITREQYQHERKTIR